MGRVEQRVRSAIVAWRTAALGGHVEACDDCGVARIAYNSCRNRHCPNCQGVARAQWLTARQAELLAVPYFHVVFTLPAPIAAIAFQNKAVVYAILFSASAEAMTTLAANPRRLGAQIGLVAVLHTWGQALTHHPHVHCVVPGGDLSPDGSRWVAGRPNFFLAVKPLSRLFRRLFIERLQNAFNAGASEILRRPRTVRGTREHSHALAAHMRRADWVVYAKKPFGGPAQVLAYLGRYTHRVAIANSRIQDCDDDHVALRGKTTATAARSKTMGLKPDDFIRRFLLHTLPDGFHRIRHFGFLANGHRTEKLAICRSLVMSQVEPIRQGKEETPRGGAGGRNQLRSSTLSRMRRTNEGRRRPSPRWSMLPLTDVAVLVRHVMSATTTIPSMPSPLAFSTQPSIGDRRTDLRSYGGVGNLIEVEQGQADGAVLESQNSSLIYYGIMVNDVYAYFLTGQKDGQILHGVARPQFPTTMADLNAITSFASAHGASFLDSQALAVEVKTSWVEAASLSNPNDYITIEGTVPTYNTSSSTTWTSTGTKTTKLALVGVHVVGSTGGFPGHPEMIWSTFEHFGNTPNAAYQYVNKNGVLTSVPQNVAGTWLFSASNSSGPFNNMHMTQSGSSIQALPKPPATTPPPFTISPSDTIRWKAFGAASDISPNPIDGNTANSNTEIISINNNISGMMAAGDVRNNYFMTGATWTIGGAPPTAGQPSPGNPGNQVGTSQLANSTMETYEDGNDTTSSNTGTNFNSNCFSCHASGGSPIDITVLSHIYGVINPLF